jgi:hypothetical protein
MFTFCSGGHYVNFPQETIRIFGTELGGKVYGFYVLAYAGSNIFQYIVTIAFKKAIGYEKIFWIFGGMSVFSLIMLYAVGEMKYHAKDKKNEEEIKSVNNVK